MNKAYRHYRKVRKENIWQDDLLKRLRQAYRNTAVYQQRRKTVLYNAALNIKGVSLSDYFYDWLKIATPEELQCEFNEHEIIELLSDE